MNGFTFWRTYWDVAQELNDKQKGEFYRAIADYMFTDDDPESRLTGVTKIAFKAIKPNLKTSQNRSLAGKTGGSNGQPYGNQNASKNKAKTKQNEAKTKQYQDKDKDKVKDKDQKRAGEVLPLNVTAKHALELAGRNDAKTM